MHSDDLFLIRICGLSVKFEPRNLPTESVLSDVHITLERGLIHFLTGGNGTGKTSLLKTLMGLLPANTASSHKHIQLTNGAHISGCDLPRMLRVGYIPQHPHEAIVPAFNVSENMAFRSFLRGNIGFSDWLLRQRYKKELKQRIKQTIDSFEITRALLANKLDNSATQLSGGEQQILNLAAMIFDECDLLIMDEPTSKLDAANKRKFWELIKEIKTKRPLTMLVVTHDLSDDRLRQVADRVFSIQGTKVVESTHLHDPSTI